MNPENTVNMLEKIMSEIDKIKTMMELEGKRIDMLQEILMEIYRRKKDG